MYSFTRGIIADPLLAPSPLPFVPVASELINRPRRRVGFTDARPVRIGRFGVT